MSEKSKTIKGILIDSEKKELREVELNQKNYRDDIKKFVKCDYFESAKDCLTELPDPCDDDIIVDEIGLLHDGVKNYFHLPEKTIMPFGGNGLILGTDQITGEKIGHSMTERNIEYLRKNIRFTSNRENEPIRPLS